MAERKTAPVPNFFERDGFPGETAKVLPHSFAQVHHQPSSNHANGQHPIPQSLEEFINARRETGTYTTLVAYKYLSEPLSPENFFRIASQPFDLAKLLAAQRRTGYRSKATKVVTLQLKEGFGKKAATFFKYFTQEELEPDLESPETGPKDEWANVLLAANLIFYPQSPSADSTPDCTKKDIVALASQKGIHFNLMELKFGFLALSSKEIAKVFIENGTIQPKDLNGFYSKVSDWLASFSEFKGSQKNSLIVEPYPISEQYYLYSDVRFLPFIAKSYLTFFKMFEDKLTPRDKADYYVAIVKFVNNYSQARANDLAKMPPEQRSKEPQMPPDSLQLLKDYLEELKKAITS